MTKVYTFSIDVRAESEEEACQKFRNEEIQPEQMDITVDTIEEHEYLRNSSKCPKCKSDQIEGGSIEIEGNTAFQNVQCLDCDFDWNDLYTLTGMEENE